MLTETLMILLQLWIEFAGRECKKNKRNVRWLITRREKCNLHKW